jgi:choline dehydrogenase-like flavoprotein
MIIQGKNVDHSVTESADVCIVGSGAAGAILAWEMAEAGHSVVLLEKGGYHTRENFIQKEDVMIPMLYKNCGLQFTVPSGIAVAQGSCVGGSTVVNDAVCFRTPETVLGWWEHKFRIKDISLDTMKKYSEKVEQRLSVSEVQPYELNKNNLVLKNGSEKLGWAASPNSRNCKSCRQCGLCHLGCYYGTKQSMLETYIPDTESVHGDITKIYADTKTDSVVKSGNHVKGVKATITGKDGHTFSLDVNAKVVIISAGTIASSELLLNSGIDVNGRVGKGVAIHPSPAMIGDFEEEINGNQGIPMGYHCHEFSVLKTGKRGYMLESVFLAPYEFSLPLPGFDYEHKEFMSRYPHYALIGSLLQDDTVGTVMLGGPVGALLNYELTEGDAKMMIEGMKNSARVLFAAGATRVITSHRQRTILYSEDDLHLIDEKGVASMDINIGSAHPQGGNAMGELPGISVVDSHSEVFGVDNLFVCDASVFPTAVGVNPQLTVMTLAMRLAEYLGDNWIKHAAK